MSVEEAREELELEAERTFCGRGTEHHPHQLDAWLYRGDRLVLQVQAEMPCYVGVIEVQTNGLAGGVGVLCWRFDSTTRCAKECPYDDLCPSCKAREDLKVPA